MEIRDSINQAFQEKLKNKDVLVVASITTSFEKKNIILTTTPDFSAEFLQENKSLWGGFFSFERYQKNEQWAQLVAHRVPLSLFKGGKGLELLKQELQGFNPVQVEGSVRWLSPREKRELPTSTYASAVFAVKNEEEQKRVLSQGPFCVAGQPIKMVKYRNISASTQCSNCQKFGHWRKVALKKRVDSVHRDIFPKTTPAPPASKQALRALIWRGSAPTARETT